MKNSGLKNEAQVAKIFVSGSDALPQTNNNGVRLFKESDLSDGIIGGKLVRPKYNTKELKKSIDTTIFELLPNDIVDGPPMVLRTIYQEALDRITELNALLERLNVTIGERDATIAELQSIIESLEIEINNLLSNINDEKTHYETLAERSFLKFLDGSCRSPISSSAYINQTNNLTLYGAIAKLDGTLVIKSSITGLKEDAVSLGQELGKEIIAKGGNKILHQ